MYVKFSLLLVLTIFKDIITVEIAFDFISLLELIDKQNFRNWWPKNDLMKNLLIKKI